MSEKILIALSIYEVIVRLYPTKINQSIIDLLHKIISSGIPNRALGKDEIHTSLSRTTTIKNDDCI